MPSVILRKIFKDKEYSLANQKGLSLHGPSVSKALVNHLNDALSTLTINGDANRPAFKWNPQEGHYYAFMNHVFQKKFEEDAVAEILDVMEAAGWKFQFQYDSSFSSQKVFGGESETSNELWIFTKEPKSYEIFKESVDTKAGISLTAEDSGNISVTGLSTGGLFEATGIPMGAVVMSINDVPVKGKTAKEVVALITSKHGMVKVLTY